MSLMRKTAIHGDYRKIYHRPEKDTQRSKIAHANADGLTLHLLAHLEGAFPVCHVSNSGSFAMFTAIRRASSLLSTWLPSAARVCKAC